MCRRAGTKMVCRSLWRGFGTMTGTRMASWRIKLGRIGRLSRRPRRKFLLTAGRLGRSGAAPLPGRRKVCTVGSGRRPDLRDGGGRSCSGRSDKGSVFLVFPTGLDDGPKNIGGLARGGDEIESAVVQCVKILIPIRKARGHNDTSVLMSGASGSHNVTIIPVGKPPVAEDQGDSLRLHGLPAFTYPRRANPFVALFAKNFVESS